MPYIFVRENFYKWWVRVEGLAHGDVRTLVEKMGEQPEKVSDPEKTVEFSVPSWMVRTSFIEQTLFTFHLI